MSRPLRTLLARVRRRLQGEEGFTLVELTIVLLILGIIMTIALPSYLSFKDRANRTAARESLTTIMKSVNSYRIDNFPGNVGDPNTIPNDVGFENISLGALNTKYDAQLPTTVGQPYVLNPAGFTVTDPATFVCVTAVAGRYTAAATYSTNAGGDGRITVGTTFTPGTCSAS